MEIVAEVPAGQTEALRLVQRASASSSVGRLARLSQYRARSLVRPVAAP